LKRGGIIHGPVTTGPEITARIAPARKWAHKLFRHRGPKHEHRLKEEQSQHREMNGPAQRPQEASFRKAAVDAHSAGDRTLGKTVFQGLLLGHLLSGSHPLDLGHLALDFVAHFVPHFIDSFGWAVSTTAKDVLTR
jgi:hypothetical protein